MISVYLLLDLQYAKNASIWGQRYDIFLNIP